MSYWKSQPHRDMKFIAFTCFAVLVISVQAGLDVESLSDRTLPLYEQYTGKVAVYDYQDAKGELVSTISITARTPEVVIDIAVPNPTGSVETTFARVITVSSSAGKVQSFVLNTDGDCSPGPEVDDSQPTAVPFPLGFGYSDPFAAARKNKACVFVDEEERLSHFSCYEEGAEGSPDLYYHYWVAEDGTPTVYAFSDNKDETLHSDGLKYVFDTFDADKVDSELLTVPRSCKDPDVAGAMIRFPVEETAKACDNDGDKNALAQKGETKLRSDIKGCAIRCAGAKDCAADCVRKATNISEGCSKCFGENVACVLKKCAVVCALSETKCNKCQAEKCQGDFIACAGNVIP